MVPVKNGKEGLYSKPLLVRTQPAAPATPLITAFNYTTIPGEIIVSFDRKWSISGGIIKEFEVCYWLYSFIQEGKGPIKMYKSWKEDDS